MRPTFRRARALAATAALLSSLLLLPAPSHAGTLHIALDALPCPSRDEIARDLGRRVADLMAQQPDLALLVAVQKPQTVTLRLVGTATTWERTLAFTPGEDCSVLPSTVALLLRSWLSRPLIAAASSAGEAPPDLPPALGPPLPPPAPPPARMRFTALAGLFESFGSDGAGPTLSLSVEHSIAGPFGIALSGAWDGPVHARGAGGSISVSAATLGLAARVTPRSTESFALDLLAGPALAIIDAQPNGYDTLAPQVLTDLALTAAARLRVRLGGPVWWSAIAEFAIRRYRETFVIDDDRLVLSVDPTRIRVLTGLTCEAF